VTKLTDWIKRHQVAAFFMISFATTWGLGFSYSAVLKRDQVLLLPLVFVTACGPGLAGIIISAVTNTQSNKGSRKVFWNAFLAAWFVSSLICLANWKFIEHSPLSPTLVIIIIIAVVPIAFVIASAYSTNPSVRSYLASLVQMRGVWSWSLLALLLVPALVVISIPVYSFLGMRPIPSYQLPEISLALIGLIIVKFLYQLFFFNATGEETGWRGFAMPRLQTRASPLITALIIAVFWAPWHFFFWQTDGKPVMTLQFWALMYAGHILLSVVIVWICNRAKGSILVAGIMHAAINTVQAFIPIGDLLLLTLSVAALVMIIADRMWEKLPPDHPAVYRSPEHAAQPSVEPTPTLAP